MFSNLVLDLVDFKDRVRPLAKDISLMDVSRTFQKHNVNELLEERKEFMDVLNRIKAGKDQDSVEEGYSSRELEAPKHDDALEEDKKQ